MEYNSIIKGKTLPNRTFDNLENFILSNSRLSEFINISIKKSLGKVITVKNYVGVICTKDGATIEILPKIGKYNDIVYTRKVFLNMLKSTKDIPFKSIQKAHIKSDSIPMLDIFIYEFFNSLESILLHGIKSRYVNTSENSKYLKGKLDYTNHIKNNTIRKDRFYIKHDTFTTDCPENRLIKSTLLLLKTLSNNDFKIQKMLSYFENVKPSINYFQDFNNCKISMYTDILNWCNVFLMGNGFTPFAGDSLNYALLFPMERVFESYVANIVKKSIVGYSIKIQSGNRYLLDEPKKFSLTPDIILENNLETIILDTKWKLLNLNSKNYGISQQDMYQMYAYAKKYNSKRVILIYPLSDDGFKNKSITFQTDDITIEIKFIYW